jgi:hypothetical protein
VAEHEEVQPFVVHDRRRFGPDGEPRASVAVPTGEDVPRGDEVPTGAAATAAEALRKGPKGPSPEDEPAGPQAPAVDFTTFIFSLGTSALMHMGDQPHPETGESSVDLALAKETIDLLAMLQEKTKGNLSSEEERFVGALLYDLRLRFVQASQRQK